MHVLPHNTQQGLNPEQSRRINLRISFYFLHFHTVLIYIVHLILYIDKEWKGKYVIVRT